MLLKDLSALASPLNDQQMGQLQQAMSELSPQQLAWVSGYFLGSKPNGTIRSGECASQSQLSVAAQPAGKLSYYLCLANGKCKRRRGSVKK